MIIRERENYLNQVYFVIVHDGDLARQIFRRIISLAAIGTTARAPTQAAVPAAAKQYPPPLAPRPSL